jgi:hypothetical protein
VADGRRRWVLEALRGDTAKVGPPRPVLPRPVPPHRTSLGVCRHPSSLAIVPRPVAQVLRAVRCTAPARRDARHVVAARMRRREFIARSSELSRPCIARRRAFFA